MEFIGRYHDGDELMRVRDLLHRKGIPTYASLVEGWRMGEQWALFVHINEQADDARRVLEDPRHEPANIVDMQAFEDALREQSADTSLIARGATWVGVGVAIAFALVVLVYGRALSS